MLKHLVPIVAATLLLLIIWASAVPLFHWFQTDEPDFNISGFQEQWNASGLDGYEFVIEKSCRCDYPANVPVRIVVRDGLNIAAYDNRQPYDPVADKIDNIPRTMPDIFRLLHAANDRGDLTRAEFDGDSGIPVTFELDPDKAIREDEVHYEVSGFRSSRSIVP